MKGQKTRTPRRPPTAPAQTPYEAEKHLRDFCNATSHELSSVLGAIVGELDFALSSTATSTNKEQAMKLALAASEKALSLARNLRYFAVHTRLDVQPSDVAQLVLDTLDLVEADLETKKIRLEVRVEAGTYAFLDPGAIQQVLLNLFTNAGKAMTKTGGTLALSLVRKAATLEITCQDTGPGIAKPLLETLFEPCFDREHIPHFAEKRGLGLSVSRALAEAHGGSLTVQSKLKKGTTFVLTLPIHNPAPKIAPFLEKRRFRRVQVFFPATLTLPKTTPPVPVEVTTLSVGGCFVRFATPGAELPPVSSSVDLTLRYYDEQTVTLPGVRVANHVRQPSQSGIGIEFGPLDAKAKRLLAAIVKSHTS